MNKAFFLDRDGLINKLVLDSYYDSVSPSSPKDFHLYPGVGEAIRQIKEWGYKVIIVSNQPGIAKGQFTNSDLLAITAKMMKEVKEFGAKIDRVYYCIHKKEDNCMCRKPKPGLILRAAKDFDIDLSQSYMIGDSDTDIEAGRFAGCVTYKTDNLFEAVQLIKYGLIPTRGTDYTVKYLSNIARVCELINHEDIEKVVKTLQFIEPDRGRLFILGVGGSAANASHAVNDFRKLTGIEAFCPTDNVAELTARINDDGWESSYVNWLKGSKLNDRDVVLVLSVGGGDAERNVSVNLVKALEYAKEMGSSICGIVGRSGGYTAKVADACVLVPTINPDSVTPLTESFQSIILHLLVSHPKLQINKGKWESL